MTSSATTSMYGSNVMQVGEMAFGNPKKYVKLHISPHEIQNYNKCLSEANQ